MYRCQRDPGRDRCRVEGGEAGTGRVSLCQRGAVAAKGDSGHSSRLALLSPAGRPSCTLELTPFPRSGTAVTATNPLSRVVDGGRSFTNRREGGSVGSFRILEPIQSRLTGTNTYAGIGFQDGLPPTARSDTSRPVCRVTETVVRISPGAGSCVFGRSQPGAKALLPICDPHYYHRIVTGRGGPEAFNDQCGPTPVSCSRETADCWPHS